MKRFYLKEKLKKFELDFRHFSSFLFSGAYLSAFKGQGMDFAESRVYVPGDDSRHIDWKTSARKNIPYTKLFEEEKETHFFLVFDVSASLFPHAQETLLDWLFLLGFLSMRNNDYLSAVFFTEDIEAYFPAAKGEEHLLRIGSFLETFTPSSSKTNFLPLFPFLERSSKHALFFFFSDFLDLLSVETTLSVFKNFSYGKTINLFHLFPDLPSFPNGFSAFRDRENSFQRRFLRFSSKNKLQPLENLETFWRKYALSAAMIYTPIYEHHDIFTNFQSYLFERKKRPFVSHAFHHLG